MDSFRSCNVLEQDTESFYKLIAENKHDHTITPSKRKKQINPHHRYFSWGKISAQNPSISMNQGIMKQYNALFSQEYVALS